MIDKIVAIFKAIDNWSYDTAPACITRTVINALDNTLIFVDKDIWSILLRTLLVILSPLAIIDLFLTAAFFMTWHPFKYMILFILGEYDDYR